MKGVKVGVVTSSISRNAGGLKGAIYGLYKQYVLFFNRNQVTLFSYDDEHMKVEINEWSLFKVQLFKKTNIFKYSNNLRYAVLNSEIDLLHIHGLWMFPHYMSFVWKKSQNKPVLISPHGMLDPYIVKNQHPVKRKLADVLFAKKAFNSADCFHALCIAELDAIRAYGIKKPVAVIPNGVDLPDPNKKFEMTDNNKHLLFLGRLHPKKGVDMLLEAIGLIKREFPLLLEGWVVDVVGWAQEGFEHKLQAIVQKYELDDTVIFHGGVFGDEKEKMYAQANAYILPSHGEGLPLTVLEAWSWHTPVLMTPMCNIPEGFESNAAIRIENNIDSIVNGLICLFQAEEKELKIMADNGMDLVMRKFTWNVAAKKMNELYLWLLNNHEKPDFVHIN